MSEQMKACPWCDKTDRVFALNFGKVWHVCCMHSECADAEGPKRDTREDAIAAWNHRPGEEAAYQRGREEEREHCARIAEIYEGGLYHEVEHILNEGRIICKHIARIIRRYGGVIPDEPNDLGKFLLATSEEIEAEQSEETTDAIRARGDGAETGLDELQRLGKAGH